MPAPSPVFTSAPDAPRWSRLQSAPRAVATMSRAGRPRTSTTNETPHESCSKRGSYSPNASGTLLYGSRGGAEEFWAFVISHPGVHTKVLAVDAEGRRWPGCGRGSLPAGSVPHQAHIRARGSVESHDDRHQYLADHVATPPLGSARPGRARRRRGDRGRGGGAAEARRRPGGGRRPLERAPAGAAASGTTRCGARSPRSPPRVVATGRSPPTSAPR